MYQLKLPSGFLLLALTLPTAFSPAIARPVDSVDSISTTTCQNTTVPFNLTRSTSIPSQQYSSVAVDAAPSQRRDAQPDGVDLVTTLIVESPAVKKDDNSAHNLPFNIWTPACSSLDKLTMCTHSPYYYYCNDIGGLTYMDREGHRNWVGCELYCQCIPVREKGACLIDPDGTTWCPPDHSKRAVQLESDSSQLAPMTHDTTANATLLKDSDSTPSDKSSQSRELEIHEPEEIDEPPFHKGQPSGVELQETTVSNIDARAGKINDYAMVCADSKSITGICARSEYGYYCDSKGKFKRKGEWRSTACEDVCKCVNLKPQNHCVLGIAGMTYCLRSEEVSSQSEPDLVGDSRIDEQKEVSLQSEPHSLGDSHIHEQMAYNNYAMVCLDSRSVTATCQAAEHGYYCSSDGKLKQKDNHKKSMSCELACSCYSLAPKNDCILGLMGQSYCLRGESNDQVDGGDESAAAEKSLTSRDMDTFGLNKYVMTYWDDRKTTAICGRVDYGYHCDDRGKLKRKGDIELPACEVACRCVDLNPRPHCLLGLMGQSYCLRDEIPPEEETALTKRDPDEGLENKYAVSCHEDRKITELCARMDNDYYCNSHGQLVRKGEIELPAYEVACGCVDMDSRPLCPLDISGAKYYVREVDDLWEAAPTDAPPDSLSLPETQSVLPEEIATDDLMHHDIRDNDFEEGSRSALQVNNFALVCNNDRQSTFFCQQLNRGAYTCDANGRLVFYKYRYGWCDEMCICVNLNPKPRCFLGISGQAYCARKRNEMSQDPITDSQLERNHIEPVPKCFPGISGAVYCDRKRDESESLTVETQVQEPQSGSTQLDVTGSDGLSSLAQGQAPFAANNYALVCDYNKDQTKKCAEAGNGGWHCDKLGHLLKKQDQDPKNPLDGENAKYCQEACDCVDLNPKPVCFMGLVGHVYRARKRGMPQGQSKRHFGSNGEAYRANNDGDDTYTATDSRIQEVFEDFWYQTASDTYRSCLHATGDQRYFVTEDSLVCSIDKSDHFYCIGTASKSENNNSVQKAMAQPFELVSGDVPDGLEVQDTVAIVCGTQWQTMIYTSMSYTCDANSVLHYDISEDGGIDPTCAACRCVNLVPQAGCVLGADDIIYCEADDEQVLALRSTDALTSDARTDAVLTQVGSETIKSQDAGTVRDTDSFGVEEDLESRSGDSSSINDYAMVCDDDSEKTKECRTGQYKYCGDRKGKLQNNEIWWESQWCKDNCKCYDLAPKPNCMVGLLGGAYCAS